MTQCFYVLYNKENHFFYVDNQWGYTGDVLLAERYSSQKEAQDNLKYFKVPQEWEVKKATVQVDI